MSGKRTDEIIKDLQKQIEELKEEMELIEKRLTIKECQESGIENGWLTENE